MGTCTFIAIVSTKTHFYSLVIKKSLNFLRFVLFLNFCSEILRKATFLESHRNFLRVGEPVLVAPIK